MPTSASESRFGRALGRAASPRLRLALAALGGLLLVGALVFLHLKTQDFAASRHARVLVALNLAKSIESRWERTMLETRAEEAAPRAFERADVLRIERALEAAAQALAGLPLEREVGALGNAYVEKADLLARYAQAHRDAREALAAAMRADAAVSGLVRAAWREFRQRERLVAAENLVSRVLAQAQQYHRTPSAPHRAALENHAADLAAAHTLPQAVQAGLARLESDVHRLLLVKPLEQTLWERLRALETRERLDALVHGVERALLEGARERERYRAALYAYAALLAVLLAVLGVRSLRRYRALERRADERAAALREIESARGQSSAEAVIEIGFKPYRRR